MDGDGFLGEVVGFLNGVATGETVPAALAIGASGLVLIVTFQRVLPEVPRVLVVVVLSIVAVGLFGLGERGVALVGVLPQGFPPLTIPDVEFSDLALLLAGALGIALVSLADTISPPPRSRPAPGRWSTATRRCRDRGREHRGGPLPRLSGHTSGSRTAVASSSARNPRSPAWSERRRSP